MTAKGPEWLGIRRVWTRKKEKQPLPIPQAPNSARRRCGQSRTEQTFHLPRWLAGCRLPKAYALFSFLPPPSPNIPKKTNKKEKAKSETEVQLSAHFPSGCPITP